MIHLGPCRVASVGVIAMVLGGCSSTASEAGAKTAADLRAREIVHEPCDTNASGAERIDANGDGQPDIVLVKVGGVERCRASDLDFDGHFDLYSYFDQGGKITRREFDYDRDGSVDEIQLYKDGLLVEKQRASTLTKRLDTWETYSQGRLVKAERDSDGNGRVDQWWEYKTLDCPIIRTDVDGNGEPDPSSQVDFCAESSYKPPEQATAAPANMLSKDTQALPTETSNVEAQEPAEPAKSETKNSPAGSGATDAGKQGKSQ